MINQRQNTLLAAMIFLFSIFSGFLFSFLFVNESTGISFPIYISFLISAILGFKLYLRGFKALNGYDLLYIPIFITSLFTVWHQNTDLLILNSLVIFSLFLPVTYFSLNPKKYPRFSYLNLNLVHLHNLIAGFVGIPKFTQLLLFAGIDLKSKSRRAKSIILNIILGCAISIPILCVFTVLFIMADDAFKEFFSDIDIDLSIEHIIAGSIVTLVSMFVGIGTYIKSINRIYYTQDYAERDKGITSIITGIILANLNFLFIAFIIVQFVYLFGDHDKVVDLGMTYSEYAVRGFWELQLVSILAFGLIYFLKRFTITKSFKAKAFIKALIALLIINVLIVIYSAHTRMNLYEDGYGYTELRLYTHTFMGLEACLFLFLFFSNIYRPAFKYFSLYSVLAGFVFLIGLNTLRPDTVIAQRNIARYENDEDKQLDIKYLLSLSSDSYLQLEDLEFDTKELYYCELTQKKEILEKEQDSWKEFNISKRKALKKLDNLTEGYDEEKCEVIVENIVQSRLDEYSEKILNKEYDKAANYWKIDEDIEDLREYIPEDFEPLDYSIEARIDEQGSFYNYDSWNSIENDDYLYFTDFANYARADAELRYSNQYDLESCKNDYLYLDIVNGKIVITSSSVLPLFEEKNRSYESDYNKNVLETLSDYSYYDYCS